MSETPEEQLDRILKKAGEENAAHDAAHKAERDKKPPEIKEKEHARGKEPFKLETFLQYVPDPTGRGENQPLTDDEIAELEWMYYDEAPKNIITMKKWIDYQLDNDLGFL